MTNEAIEAMGDDFGSDDLDFGSDPSTDVDPEESTVLTVKQIETAEVPPSAPLPAHSATPKESRAGRDLPAAIGVGLVLLGIAAVGIVWFPILLAFCAVWCPWAFGNSHK